MDEAGEGEFAPALRCAVCRGPLLRLYAGVGVVAGSRPRAEWDETRVKFQTMLSALGVARVP
jgi:isochorismate synthase EntC